MARYTPQRCATLLSFWATLFILHSQDVRRVFSQQPLDPGYLPFDYLVPDPSSDLKPPLLLCGWRIGRDKLWKVVQEHFPECIQLRRGPDPEVEHDDEYLENLSDEEWERMRPHIAETLYGVELIVGICEKLGLSDAVCELLRVRILLDSNMDGDDAFIIGTNYEGMVKDPWYSALKAIFAPNEEPKWYLDPHEWQWRREGQW